MTDTYSIQAGGVGGDPCGVVVNEAGANVDFRVEGDTDTNLLFVDGSTDSIGIGTNAPSALLHLKAGLVTASKSSMKLASGALLNSKEAGAIEYDGKVIYSTPASRGVSPSIMLATVPTSSFALQLSNSLQNCFPAQSDVITVEADTSYFFEGVYDYVTVTAADTTESFAFTLGGGASIVSIRYDVMAYMKVAVPLAGYAFKTSVDTVAAVAWTEPTARQGNFCKFFGVIRMDAGGTITPQIKFSVAPGTSSNMISGSYIAFYPIGNKTVQLVGNVA